MTADPRLPLSHCTACPRRCGADRTKAAGYCGARDTFRVARAALHQWEEPCISGTRGSGAVFFSGCSLQCCFCQNYEISSENKGKDITPEHLREIFYRLRAEGAHNINLVNPSHYAPMLLPFLREIREEGFDLPILWNSGGYDLPETLALFEGLIDIYLPDFKYFDPARSLRYSNASDYFEAASKAIAEMLRQQPKLISDENGILQKGVIIRHMVMPGGRDDSIALLRYASENFDPSRCYISIMSQYTPCYRSAEFPEINRKLFGMEYRRVMEAAEKFGIDQGFMQERSASDLAFIPDFDFTGV